MCGPDEKDEREAWDDSLTNAYLNGSEAAGRGEEMESAEEHTFDPRNDDN